jgi:AAA domain
MGSDLDARPSRNIWSELENWAAPFKPWQRFALFNIIRTGPLSEEQIEQIYSQFLSDHKLGLAPTPALEIPTALSGRPATASLEAVFLKTICNLQGANALPASAKLEFSSGLTVIYGSNGAGKSGFARVLASGCFCRNAPEILPNIYADGPQPELAATIAFSNNNGDQTEIELKANVSIPALKRMSVFDTTEARSYLTEQNPLGFKPIGFDVLS